MQFETFHFIYLLAIVPALLALYAYGFRRKRAALATLVGRAQAARLVVDLNRRRQWLKAACLLAAVASLVVALMQPQWGRGLEDVPREGRDLLVVFDVSLSMLAEDSTPNRLERAKALIDELVTAVSEDGGHRLGLVAFAGRASLHCPLTLDYEFFRERLDEVGTGTVPLQGTAIGAALRQSLHGFGAPAEGYTDIILVTDGEDHDTLPAEAAKAAAASGIGIYAVGIGDPVDGAQIPIVDDDGNRRLLLHQDAVVTSRLQEDVLRNLTQLADGAYVAAGGDSESLAKLYRTQIAPKPRRRIDAASAEQPVARYQWFVLAALLLLAADMLLPAGGRREARS